MTDLPAFPDVPAQDLDLSTEIILTGDDNEAVEKMARAFVKLTQDATARTALVVALNQYKDALNNAEVIQAKWKGQLTFTTRNGMIANGAPPDVGTPQQPLALVWGDETVDNNGVWGWVTTGGGYWVKIYDYLQGKKGDVGPSLYDAAIAAGTFTGTLAEYEQTIKGPRGFSAYEIAQAAGFVGTIDQYRASLEGGPGPIGPSPYESAVANGVFVGTELEYQAFITGPIGPSGGEQGDPGEAGQPGYENASANTMIDMASTLRWWLAGQSAVQPNVTASVFPNRGEGPDTARLQPGALVVGEAVDFRPVDIVNSSGIALNESAISSSSADRWTVAISFRWTSSAISDVNERWPLFGNYANATGLIAFVDGTGNIQVNIYGDVTSLSSGIGQVPVGDDCTVTLSWDGAAGEFASRIYSETFGVQTSVVDVSTLGDCTTTGNIEIMQRVSGGAIPGRTMVDASGQFGDLVIDVERAWTAAECDAARKAFALYYVETDGNARRSHESAYRSAATSGQGLSGETVFEVAPDSLTGGAVVPVEVSSNGVGVDATRVNAYGMGPPVDRTGVDTAKPDAAAGGTFIELDSDPEMRPAVASQVGLEVALWNSSGSDVTAYGATGVTFTDNRKVIGAGDTVIAKIMAANVWMLIGGKEA